MKNKTRILFGEETTFIGEDPGECSACSTPKGKLHEPGCSLEECPCCHELIIGCGCNCLSPLDATIIIQALYRKFTDLQSAVQAADINSGQSKGKVSYLTHAAMQYLFEHIDQKSRDQLNQTLLNTFPTLIPSFYDENGTGYYTSEQLAKAFGVAVEEIHTRIEALTAAGFTIRHHDPAKLKKRN